jgi:transcriptional regulator with XRE-family HTH domain
MYDNSRIKTMAKTAGISLSQVAADLGITKQYLSNLVNTDINFSVDKLINIFNYFKQKFNDQNKQLNSDWFLTGEGSMFIEYAQPDTNTLVIKLKKGQSLKVDYED